MGIRVRLSDAGEQTNPELKQRLLSLGAKVDDSSPYHKFVVRRPLDEPVIDDIVQGVLALLREQLIMSLSTSVEEKRAEQERFVIVAQREKRLAQESKSLTKELNALRAERHRAVSIRDDQIAQLKGATGGWALADGL